MEGDRDAKECEYGRLGSLVPTWEESTIARKWQARGGLGDLLPFGSVQRCTTRTLNRSNQNKIKDLINSLEEALLTSRYYDAQLSPTRNLPPEILSRILIDAKPADFRMTAFAYKPGFPALSVCKRWRDIAFATMPLWSAIDSTIMLRESQKQCADYWYRSHASLIIESTLSLEVTTNMYLSGDTSRSSQLLSNLLNTIGRWRSCTHFYHGQGTDDVVLENLERATSLEVLRLRRDPSGPPLKSDHPDSPPSTPSPPHVSLMNLLDLDIQGLMSGLCVSWCWLVNFVISPQLRSLSITVPNLVLSPDQINAIALSYPNLQKLRLSNAGSWLEEEFDFHFPKLRELSYIENCREMELEGDLDDYGLSFMPCISRSTELHYMHLDQLVPRISPMMPSITELAMRMGTKELVSDILTAYPNLQKLTIQDYRGGNDILEALLLADDSDLSIDAPCCKLQNLSLKNSSIFGETLFTLAMQRCPVDGTEKLYDQRVARCTITLESVYDYYAERRLVDVQNGDLSLLAFGISEQE